MYGLQKHITIILFVILSFSAFGQSSYILKGKILDQNHKALPGASLMLYPIKKGTVSDRNGDFRISNLQKNTYVIEVSFIGYNTLVDTLFIEKNTSYNAQLNVSNLNLSEVVITDNYAEQRKREESLSIELVNDDELKRYLGGSLMNSLERLPGVTTINIGSGQSKPVIRGLGFNRVVVVENNIKHEAQQWGSDHGLEIDQYAVDNIEVIKGPSSLMYGSDAIGGVIDMQNRKLPANNSIGGLVDITGKSNNDLMGTSVSVYGRKGKFFANVRATYMDYGDYKVPADSIDIYSYRAPLYKNHLRNTAGYKKNLHFTLGMVKDGFLSKLFVSSVNSKSGFFANAHGLEPRNVDTQLHDKSSRDINYPYQKVNHLKLISTNQYNWNKLKLNIDLGFQRNFREEWSKYVSHGYMPPVAPETLGFNPDLEREFEKFVYSGNAKIAYQLNEKTKMVFGMNGEFQDNRIDGRGFIIPKYKQLTLGGFTFVRNKLSEQSSIQLGVRYDYGKIDTQEYFDWFRSPIDENEPPTLEYLQRAENINRNFSNFSWSVGYNSNAENWTFKANVGKSFRMPIAKELAANGVNYHRFRYEVGDSNLSPEESYQFDANLEYHTNKLVIGTSPFVNHFSNYIYLNPTPDHDRFYGNGNQKFYYTESEVLRYGGEVHAHYEILEDLQLGIVGEYVYSEQLSGEKKGFTLPLSPPASAIFSVKYNRNKLSLIENAYFSFDYRLTDSQNKVVPPEDPTDGYQLINLGFGGDIPLGNQKLKISMQIHNLFNTRYFNHTSFYRLINVPEPGRNFIVNVTIPFSGKI